MSQTMSTTTSFAVTLADGSIEVVDGADAYQPEQKMTTFFRNAEGRQSVDCWSVRMASFRSDQILAIRRQEADIAEVRQLHTA